MLTDTDIIRVHVADVEPNTARIERAVHELLAAVGEDPCRDGLLNTPSRVARMWSELLAGYRENPAAHLATTFDVAHGELVLVKDIAFSSMCEHHMLPFTGHAHIAYLPAAGRVTGLSKLARLVAVRSPLKRATRLPRQARRVALLRVVLGAGGRLSHHKLAPDQPQRECSAARHARCAPDLALTAW